MPVGVKTGTSIVFEVENQIINIKFGLKTGP